MGKRNMSYVTDTVLDFQHVLVKGIKYHNDHTSNYRNESSLHNLNILTNQT